MKINFHNATARTTTSVFFSEGTGAIFLKLTKSDKTSMVTRLEPEEVDELVEFLLANQEARQDK